MRPKPLFSTTCWNFEISKNVVPSFRNPLLYPIELQALYFQRFASTSFLISYFVEGLCTHFIIVNQIYIVNKITKAKPPDYQFIVLSREMTFEKTFDFGLS